MTIVLFVCSGNSARSLMAEALLNQFGQGRYKALSAGTRPSGLVNSFALEQVLQSGGPTAALRSKGLIEFMHPGAANIDLLVTVCDLAASELPDDFPGSPLRVHWSLPSPFDVAGSVEHRRSVFAALFENLKSRVLMLVDVCDRITDRAQRERALVFGTGMPVMAPFNLS